MNRYIDRGNILWESSRLFLPEHKQALLQRKEDLKKVEKPLLDEQELQTIGLIMIDSFTHKLKFDVEYCKEGFFHHVIGVINRIDIHDRRIKLNCKEDKEYIQIDDIISVQII